MMSDNKCPHYEEKILLTLVLGVLYSILLETITIKERFL